MKVVLSDFSESVREQSSKMAVLVVSKILGPFGNTLTCNDQDSFLEKAEFKATNAKALIEKTKDVF